MPILALAFTAAREPRDLGNRHVDDPATSGSTPTTRSPGTGLEPAQSGGDAALGGTTTQLERMDRQRS
jgi:hypothetical protein